MENLWLDLRPVGQERLEGQFPTILGRCRALGLEPTAAPIPVAPAAHYWMGGVSTDLEAATNLTGLYAVGEVACTGVHGANRLASNSLMECLVFARRLRQIRLAAPAPPVPQSPSRPLPELPLPNTDLLRREITSLRQLCWQVAGVERKGSDLAAALREVRRRRHQLEADPLVEAIDHQAVDQPLELISGITASGFRILHDLRQRLLLAELLIEAASFRQESRGGHFRTDAPAQQPFWRCHTLQERGQGIHTRPLDQGLGTVPL